MPRCRYLVIVDDIEYYLALVGVAFVGVHDLPDVASSFARKTVLHHDVTDWCVGVIALGTGIAERRWGLAVTRNTSRSSRFIYLLSLRWAYSVKWPFLVTV
jgi:hypothetical protein